MFWHTYLFRSYVVILKIYISQSSVATQSRCEGAVGYSIITLLQNVQQMCQWKNFENWLIFGEDMDNDKQMCQWKNFENWLIFGEDMDNDKERSFLRHSVERFQNYLVEI